MNPAHFSSRHLNVLRFLCLVVFVLLVRDVACQTLAETTFFSTAAEEAYSTLQVTGGNGDLWPSCWADDDNLYAASGDGNGFGGSGSDMLVSKISGTLPSLSGKTLAKNIGTNWSGSGFDRKPTGMLCINSTLYLAFQNLDSVAFNSAPAASIAKSADHGNTWTWDATAPMFGGPGKATLFTTIFFLDYGKNSANAIDNYVYAYGLDNNWRSQQAMYLGRVLAGSIQTRSAWQFFAGTDSGGNPLWTNDITQKKPVLVDTRLLYPVMFGTDCPAQDAVIAQGGVVYDAPLERYIFSSWSCSTHEIYEAPYPWGPWSHVLSNDFGPLRTLTNRGQYGTTIPSKFISADGKTLMLQSNVCCGGNSYTFSLRKLFVELPLGTYPTNSPSNANLALAPGTRAINKSTQFGSLCALNCSDQISSGVLNNSEDDYDEEEKPADWWGYRWPQPYTFDEVVYQTGNMYGNGGWFASSLQLQVLQQSGQWVSVPPNIIVTPEYPYSSAAQAQATYTFDFSPITGTGVRIIGVPGGSAYFTSIGQLAVYYGGRNLVSNPGFENQGTSAILSPWMSEGPDTHLVEVGEGTAHTGSNDGMIQSSSSNWDALTQTVSVAPNTSYTLTGWIEDDFGKNTGSFGVRSANGAVLAQTSFGTAPTYTPLTVKFNSGANSSVTVFAGFTGQRKTYTMRLDDVSLR